VYAIVISLFDYMLQTGQSQFIGMANYTHIFQDADFYSALWVTIKIGVPAVLLEFVLGFGLAIMLNSVNVGRGILTSLLATPVMIAPAAAAMSFRMLYTPQWGPVNYILAFILRRPVQIDWLGATAIAPLVIITADVWQMAAFIMLIALAGLISISVEIYEAARIDGASGWASFLHITLPLLRLPLSVAIILRAIDLFKLFDLVFVMTRGGPAGATETVSYYTYEQGLEFLRIGYGAALALVMLALALLMSRVLIRLMRREAEA